MSVRAERRHASLLEPIPQVSQRTVGTGIEEQANPESHDLTVADHIRYAVETAQPRAGWTCGVPELGHRR
ncbi:hypothetical protein FRAHR75_1470006 [Frankia sp. Hr75.2]|nr:hypothetical protein FRAHR75_1470006 [Frankia sp. Hr75.2]